MNSRYFSARYLTSAPSIRAAPEDAGAEVAFAGRSNAGKSRAINAITNQNGLARTSKTPGRTRHLVFFALDDQVRLVDLPGYGFARVPDKLKQQWQTMMDEYLTHRRSLRGLLLVMDIRHPLKEFDRQMLEWCEQSGLPVHVLLTKADKLKQGGARQQLHKVREQLGRDYPGATVQVFSALKKTGIEEVHKVLDGWLREGSVD